MSNGDPKIFVLKRELQEVHLLLDNISSDPEKSLRLGDEDIKRLGDDWLVRICQMECPPENDPPSEADNAALLIRAKDYLNGLAKPASGLTIAFTHLVTRGADNEGVARDPDDGSPSRGTLAEGAYPDLVGKARVFRKSMFWIRIFLLLWLVFTCIFSWHVAFGNAALAQRAAAKTALADAQKLVDDRLGAGTTETTPKGGTAAPVAAVPPAGVKGVASAARDCPKAPLPPGEDDGLTTQQRQACQARSDAEKALAIADDQIAHWIFWRSYDSGLALSTYAVALTGILGTAVLPVLYGILGAGAAIVRSLSQKMKQSLLAPRELNLALQRLALGAVTGACIGIFVAQPSASGAADAATAMGPVALSSSGLSFLAGFGVDAVFGALEAVIGRIFNTQSYGSQGAPPRP